MIIGMLFSANYYITPKGRKCAIQQSNRRKKFGLHSARSGGSTIVANKGVPDRLFKLHGRWVSDKAKDTYVKDNIYSCGSLGTYGSMSILYRWVKYIVLDRRSSYLYMVSK